MRILVTGGAGYIGSHTCAELLAAGHDVLILDNMSNSDISALAAISRLSGKDAAFRKADVTDYGACSIIIRAYRPDAIIHFAGLKSVSESAVAPLDYYRNNVAGTLCILRAMREYGVPAIVFSSSATVYGVPESVPVTEDSPVSAVSPYGATKLLAERMISDEAAARPGMSAIILRYFNPVGAHPSGLIGENPVGTPNNLMPYISMVASGKLSELSVYGGDYPTRDGTGVRDYVHVVDLAKGHLAALDKKADKPGVHVYNLGTGRGLSVIELVGAFSEASGRDVSYRIVGRRKGDVAECWADVSKAGAELGFKAERDIGDMCRDAWNYEMLRDARN